MLIDFSVENFRSIKNEARLSLVATASKEHQDTHVMSPSLAKGVKPMHLLRTVALYGPNAGGKSNLIKALDTMRTLVLRSHQHLDRLPITPFKFASSHIEAPTTFEVVFISDSVRYQYGFSACAKKVYDEWLYAFPRGRTQIWFERSVDPTSGETSFHFGDKLMGDKDVWKRATRPNALFLTTAIQLNSQQLQPIYQWFTDKLRLSGIAGWSPKYSMDCCLGERKQSILDFLRTADFAIADVHVSEEDMAATPLPPELPDQLRELLESESTDRKKVRLKTSHETSDGQIVELDFADESDGTRKMFSFAGPWLDALEHGRILVIDELNGSLHPLLVKYLIALFHNPAINTQGAQLIFTTHETAMLDQAIFRRDQIWFCERDSVQSTVLFPLTDFTPRKGVDNLERAYLSGRYGALPFVSDSSLAGDTLHG